MAKKFVKLGLGLIVLSAIGYGSYTYKIKSTKLSAEEPVFKEQKVIKGDIALDFSADGEVNLSVTNLDFEIGGKLKEVLVKQDQEIKKGQIVAKLDDTDYINKLKSAQVSYDQTVIKLEQTKQNYELQIISEKQKLDDLKSQLDKVNSDYQLQIISEKQKLDDLKVQFDKISSEYLPMKDMEDYYSKQEIEQKKLSYENAKSAYEAQLEKYDITEKQLKANCEDAKADYEVQLQRYNILLKDSNDVEAAKASVRNSEISLNMAKDDLNKTILTSPTDGKILYVSYKEGESVPTSAQSNTATANTDHFILVTDLGKAQVISAVSEEDLSNVSIGQDTEVVFDALDNKIFTGKVISIDPLPKRDNTGIVTYDVTIELNEASKDVKIGMNCSISFVLKQKKDVLVIPNSAVTMVEGKQSVQVKDKEGNIVTKTVVTGLTDGKNTEVMDGLKEGETLIIQEKK
ncbi:efflux RND transporter periplasmic adaptor subunit [Clostridium ganghwense]|nr:biotin/lipoyl-binding protein [Clostridium ganghwense]